MRNPAGDPGAGQQDGGGRKCIRHDVIAISEQQSAEVYYGDGVAHHLVLPSFIELDF